MDKEEVAALRIHELKLHAAEAIEREEYEDAESMYRDLLTLYDEDDEESPSQLGALRVFTRLLLLKGNAGLSEAITYFEKALVITCNIFGTDHPETAASLVALASALRKGDEEQLREAEGIFKQALKILKKIHGKETPNDDTATALLGMGMCIEAQGIDRYEDARPVFEKAVSMRLKLFGEKHPETGDAVLCLAALLGSQSEELVASGIRYEQALKAFRSVYNEQHPRVLLCLDSMALLYRRQAKDLRGQKLFGEATVAEMAATKKCGGGAIVSGYFWKHGDTSFGFKKQKKIIYAALYPERQGQESSSGKGKKKSKSKEMDKDRVVLFWAYDEEPVAGGFFGGKDKDGEDNGMGAIVEISHPSADVVEEEGKKGEDSEYLLKITSGTGSKTMEVFSAYGQTLQVIDAWFEVLGIENEDEDED
jgi:tetratricopeptide (TPR) repeat protein